MQHLITETNIHRNYPSTLWSKD